MAVVQTDPYSQRPFFVKLYFGEAELAVASAFFVKVGSAYSLVTAWHNLSGRHPETGKFLSAHGGVPDSIACYLIRDGDYIQREWIKFSLSDEDGPLWYEHPVHGRQIDVAVLPIAPPVGIWTAGFNELNDVKMDLQVSHDVFILGYPLGLLDAAGMPIWKKASVASEPGTSSPRILVDTASRSGMSGAPVLHRYRGVHMSNPTSGLALTDWFGEGSQFVGVYSGRLGASEFEAQLGIVWKASVIDEISAGQCRAKWS